jgi:hypothetical protein
MQYCEENLRSINPLILFGVRKNCLISGRNPLFYKFTTRAIKLTVVIMEEGINFIRS